MNKKKRALGAVKAAMVELEKEIAAYHQGKSSVLSSDEKADYLILGNQLEYIKATLIKMKEQLDDDNVSSCEDRLSFGRVIVDSWPISKGLGSLRDVLLEADVAFENI